MNENQERKLKLLRQVDEMKREIDRALTCTRRRVGDAFVDALGRPKALIKLPVTLLSIYRDYRRGGDNAAMPENDLTGYAAMADEQSLLRQIDWLKDELNTVLTCKRRQIGDAVFEAFHHPVAFVKLPFTLYGLYRDHATEDNVPEASAPAPVSATIAAPMASITETPVPEEAPVPEAPAPEKPAEPFAFRLPSAVAPMLPKCAPERTADIIVCVHNALDDVRRCLQSLLDKRTFPYGIILVDDGSDEETAACLRDFAALSGATLIRHETGRGYTISANAGLRASHADYAVLLNSDTVVTDRFVEKMIRAFEKDKSIGILSPLSNAATHQSIPDVVHGKDWAINDLPEGMNAEAMNLAAELAGEAIYPHLSCVNGFCLMIRRGTIDAIGYLDEETFPRGYGEEVDYCIRAEQAGIRCCVLDDTYIFHAKSKSFKSDARKKLSTAANVKLSDKHGAAHAQLGAKLKTNVAMDAARERVNASVSRVQAMLSRFSGKRIVFLLPSRTAAGGVNSVCQEAAAMCALGLDVRIANRRVNREAFEANYAEWKDRMLWYDASPVSLAGEMDIVVCTIFTTVSDARALKHADPRIRVAYYVQDYEPLFFDEGEPYYERALESYTLIPGNLMFAKTDWICRTVKENHAGADIHRVKASIDWQVYNPWRVKHRAPGEQYVVTAMLRPGTPRRNPLGTLRVLKDLSARFDGRVEIHTFGCCQTDLAPFADAVEFSFINHGPLKRWEVAELLAKSDLFVDMSTYQAFGRTGIEAMCFGCVPLLPCEGGTDEYAVHRENALVVDTGDADAAAKEAIALLSDDKALARMSEKCLETARRYSAFASAWSEITVLSQLTDGETKGDIPTI